MSTVQEWFTQGWNGIFAFVGVFMLGATFGPALIGVLLGVIGKLTPAPKGAPTAAAPAPAKPAA